MPEHRFVVLVCGSRDWTDGVAIEAELGRLINGGYGITEVIHGAARGADVIAGQIAHRLGFPVTEYPANWREHGPRAAGPRRNKVMLGANPDLVLAFKDRFNWALTRGGTEHMVKISLGAGVAVRVIDRGESDVAVPTAYGARPARSLTGGPHD